MTDARPQPEIERLLTGGHPNSLGRTEEVAERLLDGEWSVDDLVDTYGSADPVVRLRVSSVLKRATLARPDLVVPVVPRLLGEVAALDQASAQWTLARVFGELADELDPAQREAATRHLFGLLAEHDDWIVQNQTIDTLTRWATTDAALRDELLPLLHRHAGSPRKSVAGRARKALAALGADGP